MLYYYYYYCRYALTELYLFFHHIERTHHLLFFFLLSFLFQPPRFSTQSGIINASTLMIKKVFNLMLRLNNNIIMLTHCATHKNYALRNLIISYYLEIVNSKEMKEGEGEKKRGKTESGLIR